MNLNSNPPLSTFGKGGAKSNPPLGKVEPNLIHLYPPLATPVPLGKGYEKNQIVDFGSTFFKQR